MPNQQWLTVGASALIAGTVVSVALPSAKPIAFVAASTAGAVGGTLLTRSQKISSSTFAVLELSNEQIIGSLTRLEHLLIDNKDGLIVLKSQIDEVRSNILQPTSVMNPVQTDQALIEEKENVSEQETAKISNIIDWLKALNLSVESYKEPQQVDALFDSVAMPLGQQYSTLKTFHRQIKFNISKGGEFSFRLNEKNREDINRITSFCKLLNDRSFLPCRYLPSQKIILAKPPTNPNMINFFTGDWFESFVYQQICKFLSGSGLEYISLRQITGTFDNGRNFELDIFFLIDNQPLWIECKAGRDYNEYLTRYTKLRKLMRIPKERAFLVIADLSSEQAVDYTSLWEITVASIDSFIELIGNALGLENNQEHKHQNTKELQTAEIPRIGKNELLKFFNKKSLHPYPEYRNAIIDGLVEVFRSLNQLITMNQIKDRLSENTQIARSKINDILRALMRSDCLLDKAGESIPSYTTPISSLLSLDPTILEQKCIETYASTVLAVNPNYFDDSRNRREFKETTGGEVPDREVIKCLLEKEEVEPTEGE
ncbi:hypothetical protein AB3R30_18925 [Leptolyngbyaceae cyanobacterium UHCC 1019]